MSFESNEPVTTSTPLTPQSAAPALTAPDPVAPAPVVAVAPVRKKRGPIDWLLAGAAILAIGGVAFAVGRTTAPAAAADFTGFPGGGVTIQPGGSFDPGAGPGGGAGGPGFFGGGPTIEGTVTSVDADSITVQLASGDEVTFATDADTTYHESTAADAGAVQVGDEVAVQTDGGRFVVGGNGQGNGGQGADPGTGGARDLTANDVTVQR